MYCEHAIHNELSVYSCACDTQEVGDMQQVHGRVPTTPTLTVSMHVKALNAHAGTQLELNGSTPLNKASKPLQALQPVQSLSH